MSMSPGGRPFREFQKDWCMCGESLFTDAIAFFPVSDDMQWVDNTELYTDLSLTVKEIEVKLNFLESTSAMAHLCYLPDPFANVVLIDKTIRLPKEGRKVKARRSLLVLSDSYSASKYRNISGLGLFMQADGYGGTTNQTVASLSDVLVSSENKLKLLEGPESVSPHQCSSANSPSFEQGFSEEQVGFGCTKKSHKKSRKISEMQLSGSHSGDTVYHVELKQLVLDVCLRNQRHAHLKDDDLLISAIIKPKTFKATKKGSISRSKPLKNCKTSKGSCRLMPRRRRKGSKHITEGKWSTVRARTVLSWLIHTGAVSVNEVIQYQDPNNDIVIKDGLVTWDGIHCNCCNRVLSISGLKSHAALIVNQPCLDLLMESGKPLTLCQLEAWSEEYKARKITPNNHQVDENDENDDKCGCCGDVGELICCDSCPSAFHQECLFEQDLPEGSWYCPQCRCQIRGNAVNDKETSQLQWALICSQCDNKCNFLGIYEEYFVYYAKQIPSS